MNLLFFVYLYFCFYSNFNLNQKITSKSLRRFCKFLLKSANILYLELRDVPESFNSQIFTDFIKEKPNTMKVFLTFDTHLSENQKKNIHSNLSKFKSLSFMYSLF